ncbi:MAG: bifunctional diguanylate cyclase/phosphodiesterase [Burkholderiaceae bacterium]
MPLDTAASRGWALIALAFALLAVAACVAWLRTRGRWTRTAADLAQVAAELERARSVDPLTDLSTRREFERAIDDALALCEKKGSEASLLLIKIDHFRSVNDAYGSSVGDETLRQIALRLQEFAKGKGPAAWLQGNEFAILVPGNAIVGASTAAALSRTIGQPMKGPGGTLRLTCSMGIASYPAQPRRTIFDKAAVALQGVKALGGAGHASYDPKLEEVNRDNARNLHDLRRAVENQELFLHYQPKIDAASLQITAVEALVRWRHPASGVISPEKFIPLAERYGLIQPIGRWVIEEACRQAVLWRDQGMRMRIAVNISADQMRQADFVDHLAHTLQMTNTPPGRFTCEITESIAMGDTEATRDTFERLRELGVHVSIDDFGTGHSSLASLKRLPAAELKIDRAFVTDLATSEHAQFIANTIVQMAHALSLRVVAEGVETRQQRDLLVAMGCDELQGYLFAEPMPAQDLVNWSAHDAGSAEAIFRPSIFAETGLNRLS